MTRSLLSKLSAAALLMLCATAPARALQPQIITDFAPATPIDFAKNGAIALSATGGDSRIAIVFGSMSPAVCSVQGHTARMLAVGLCTLTANQAGNAKFEAAAEATASVQINKSSQAINFPTVNDTVYGHAPFVLHAKADSGLAIAYASVTPAICAISNATVTVLATGNCVITADQAGDANFNAADQVTQSFAVNPAAQKITFAPLVEMALGAQPFEIAATSSSGLAVAFSSKTTPVCTVTGNTVALQGAGKCTIVADQPGDASYRAAPKVQQAFTVTGASQTISFAPLPPQTAGEVPFRLSATSSSGLAVKFTSTTQAVCTVTGVTVNVAAGGTCTITANQRGNLEFSAAPEVTQSFTVSAVNQFINFFGGGYSIPIGGAPFEVTAHASSFLPVLFTSLTPAMCSAASDESGAFAWVTGLNVGTCIIAADQAGNGVYNAAPRVTLSITITAGSQTISFAPLADVNVGSAPFVLTATASSGLPVMFASSTPQVCTVAGALVSVVGVGTCAITASQPGNGAYMAAASVAQIFAVAKVPPTVALASPIAGQSWQAPATIPLSVNVSGTGATIVQVEYFNGTQSLGRVSAAPYTLSWSAVPVGTYSVTAVATDSLGSATRSAAVAVIVTRTLSVRLTSPVVGTSLAGPAQLTVTAEVTLGISLAPVAYVDLFNGTTLIGRILQPPYSSTVAALPQGSYSFSASVVDTLGVTATSMPVAVTVTAPDSGGAEQVYDIHTDQLNTPQLVTDARGNQVWRWEQDLPFGERPPNQDPNGTGKQFELNLRFPGQYYDKETNLHYNYFRDYDPQTGRYIESDPIGLAGGINTYGYGFGNPISHTDPFGLAPPGAPSDSPGVDFLKAIFPNSDVTAQPPDSPPTSDECVQKYLRDHYGKVLGALANAGNLQQLYPSNNPEAGTAIGETAHIAAEKIILTQTPGAVGARIVTAVPGSLAVGNRIGAGLIATTTGLSGTAELAGAFLTPFGTTAMAIAREACTCNK